MTRTAAQEVYVMLRDSGTTGVHSLTIRQSGVSGNPSERFREIASHGVDIRKRREQVGKRPGVRAWLGEFAPPDAVPVTASPQHLDSTAGGHSSSGPSPSDRGVLEPVAILRDYTDPEGKWKELPVSAVPGLERWAA